jgi:hypothetical protein
MSLPDKLLKTSGPSDFLVAFQEWVNDTEILGPLHAAGNASGGPTNIHPPPPDELILSFETGTSMHDARESANRALGQFAEVEDRYEERKQVELIDGPEAPGK